MVNNAESNSTTIRFDVGGTIYRVSRSLLDQYPNTMLARMASETWLDQDKDNLDENKDVPLLFIDRDGERFRYVLDFMRDGAKMCLPMTIPVKSFVNDLEYYGFENIKEESFLLCPSNAVYLALVNEWNQFDDKFANDISEFEMGRLAHFFFKAFQVKRSLVIFSPEFLRSDKTILTVYNQEQLEELGRLFRSLKEPSGNRRAAFQKGLNKYGLKFVDLSSGEVQLMVADDLQNRSSE